MFALAVLLFIAVTFFIVFLVKGPFTGILWAFSVTITVALLALVYGVFHFIVSPLFIFLLSFSLTAYACLTAVIIAGITGLGVTVILFIIRLIIRSPRIRREWAEWFVETNNRVVDYLQERLFELTVLLLLLAGLLDTTCLFIYRFVLDMVKLSRHEINDETYIDEYHFNNFVALLIGSGFVAALHHYFHPRRDKFNNVSCTYEHREGLAVDSVLPVQSYLSATLVGTLRRFPHDLVKTLRIRFSKDPTLGETLHNDQCAVEVGNIMVPIRVPISEVLNAVNFYHKEGFTATHTQKCYFISAALDRMGAFEKDAKLDYEQKFARDNAGNMLPKKVPVPVITDGTERARMYFDFVSILIPALDKLVSNFQ